MTDAGPQISVNTKSNGFLEIFVEAVNGSAWLLANWQSQQTDENLILSTGSLLDDKTC